MKNFLFTLSILSIFSLTTSFAAAPNANRYGMTQSINFSKITKDSVIQAPISQDILKANSLDFGQLQITDQNNEPVKFSIQETPAQNIKYLESVELSSQKYKEEKSENIFDDNVFTLFQFDRKKEGQKNPSTIFIDFGKPTKINRITIKKEYTSNIQAVEIKGGNQKENLKTLKRKTKFQKQINSDFPKVQFLKISLWGKHIALEDILFYTPYTATAYFTAVPNQQYKFLFGSPDLDSKRFTSRFLETPKFDITAKTGKSKNNKIALTDDIDGDNIKNSEDNCPFFSNSNQKDSDSDSVGDKCDNAPNIKNYSQADSDRDLIGDIIDNCDFTPNFDQKDNDKDLIGNACDASPDAGNGKSFYSNLTSSTTNSSSSSITTSGGFWGFIAGAIALFFGGIFFFKKKK